MENNWMVSPGNRQKSLIIIYNIAELAYIAYSRAVASSNIMKGFKITVFVPFNDNIFFDNEHSQLVFKLTLQT